MNLKSLVKLSNVVALIAITLLIYWVFVFVSTEVFGLKVFRENISQTFAMSILGIMALMAGSLMINVMFNLTRIAEKHNHDQIIEAKAVSKKLGWVFLLSFPIIFGLLFGGDYLTSKKKEAMLIQSAKNVVETSNTEKINKLVNYEFTENWLVETDDTLDVMSKADKNFPQMMVIVKDKIDNSDVYLGFREYTKRNDNTEPDLIYRKNYIFSTTQPERDYLKSVFDNTNSEIRFSASDGKYQLFYPYSKDGKNIVLYFSDFQRYGKFGS
jgi:Domain of unknown function (DUF1980)